VAAAILMRVARHDLAVHSLVLAICALGLASVALAACGGNSSSVASLVVATASVIAPTVVPTRICPYPTGSDPVLNSRCSLPLPNSPDEVDTRIADLNAMIAATSAPTARMYALTYAAEDRTSTATALTPTVPEPTSTTKPTPVWEMGVIQCPEEHGGFFYSYPTCWRGVVNGELLTVMAAATNEEGTKPWNQLNPDEGVIVVYHNDEFWRGERGSGCLQHTTAPGCAKDRFGDGYAAHPCGSRVPVRESPNQDSANAKCTNHL